MNPMQRNDIVDLLNNASNRILDSGVFGVQGLSETGHPSQAIVMLTTWLAFRQRTSVREAIRRIDGIHYYLSDLSEEESISPANIRSIQDEIFEHRRSNPPVPDWFYWRERDCQESEAANP